MMSIRGQSRIWLAQHRVDFRRQHQGLLAEAYKLNLDPFCGDILIFIGKGKRRIKVLYADESGLWLSSKLFTTDYMKTKFNFLLNPSCNIISTAELAMLIEGTKYIVEKRIASTSKNIDKTTSNRPQLSTNEIHRAEQNRI